MPQRRSYPACMWRSQQLAAITAPIGGEVRLLGWIKKLTGRPQPLSGCELPIDQGLFDGPGDQLYQAIAAHWSEADSNYRPMPNARDRVDDLERRYALRLPEDFRNYLIHASPSEIYWDHIGTQWWTITEIKNIPDECPDGPVGGPNPEIEAERDHYLVFADFLIWCYAWAICCSDGPNRGKIALIGGAPDGFVADSFREFMKLELTNDAVIHVGRKRHSER